MRYITTNRFKKKSISGDVNIPYGTELMEKDKILYLEEKPICSIYSQNAYDYFSINDDNNGLERGKLIKQIINKLSKKDKNYQKRWDKIWDDKICQKYKKDIESNYWLWNFYFYNAEIESLRYILNLICHI